MSFLLWIESTAYAEYVRVAAYGYAAMITLHSLGLAIMVGLSAVLSLRVLGLFRAIPINALREWLTVAWLGFVVNFISGASLFATQATTYVTNTTFLIKMLFVLLGAIFVALLQESMSRSASVGAAARRDAGRLYAVATLAAWSGAVIAGRLTAYL